MCPLWMSVHAPTRTFIFVKLSLAKFFFLASSEHLRLFSSRSDFGKNSTPRGTMPKRAMFESSDLERELAESLLK